MDCLDKVHPKQKTGARFAAVLFHVVFVAPTTSFNHTGNGRVVLLIRARAELISYVAESLQFFFKNNISYINN